jgi:hypothetical protein
MAESEPTWLPQWAQMAIGAGIFFGAAVSSAINYLRGKHGAEPAPLPARIESAELELIDSRPISRKLETVFRIVEPLPSFMEEMREAMRRLDAKVEHMDREAEIERAAEERAARIVADRERRGLPPR